MARKIKDLVVILSNKDQNVDVEFIVVEVGGPLVCVDVRTAAVAVSKMLKMMLPASTKPAKEKHHE